MERAYKFKIYPNAAQEQMARRTFGCVRYVYNRCLAERMAAYKERGESKTRYGQQRDLTEWKRETEWLREPDKFALQNAVKDLDAAYKNFFRRAKRGGAPGFPKLKSKRDNRQSYSTAQTIRVVGDKIQLPKLGLVKCRVTRRVEGRILSATVSQNPSGKYFVSVCCTDVQIAPLPKTGAAVGIDLGLKDFAITSDGRKFGNHKHLRKSEKKLARLQRGLSRKTRGGKNRGKARIKVARMHERIANRRDDALHKLSTQIVQDYDTIAIEGLRVKNMTKNRRLAKSIGDASWGEFARQLEYKSAWYGKRLVRVDAFYPSSQLCGECGHQYAGTKDLAVREWTCPECGARHDRDVNSAKNILREGLRLIA
jgi:putative transposase